MEALPFPPLLATSPTPIPTYSHLDSILGSVTVHHFLAASLGPFILLGVGPFVLQASCPLLGPQTIRRSSKQLVR